MSSGQWRSTRGLGAGTWQVEVERVRLGAQPQMDGGVAVEMGAPPAAQCDEGALRGGAPREQELRWAKDLVRVLESAGDATASGTIRDQYGMPPPPPPPCRPQCGCHNCVRKRAAKRGNTGVATWVRVANALVMLGGALMVLATPVVLPKAAASLGMW